MCVIIAGSDCVTISTRDSSNFGLLKLELQAELRAELVEVRGEPGREVRGLGRPRLARVDPLQLPENGFAHDSGSGWSRRLDERGRDSLYVAHLSWVPAGRSEISPTFVTVVAPRRLLGLRRPTQRRNRRGRGWSGPTAPAFRAHFVEQYGANIASQHQAGVEQLDGLPRPGAQDCSLVARVTDPASRNLGHRRHDLVLAGDGHGLVTSSAD